MRVWVVEVGEPLPIDEGSPRLMRAGLLCEELAAKGHEATWFTSSFNHYRKSMRPTGEFRIEARGSHYQVVTLAATGYQRHVSPQRLWDHRTTARDLLRNTANRDAPDVICAGLPTLDLAATSARIAADRHVPLVVDVQDLWPDAFAERLPSPIRPLASPLFMSMRRQARHACAAATGIVGLTEPFLDWGLGHAGRGRQTLDRVVPLAYQPAEPNGEELAHGEAFWQRHGVDFARPIVAFVGSFSDAFEFQHIVATARAWNITHPTVQFVIAGTGPASTMLEREAVALPNLIVPGWLDGAELHLLLTRATVGLAPYLPRADMKANITNKIIEYLSAGLPIATALQEGLTPELLRSTGTGTDYDPQTALGLGDALDSIMASEAGRADMSERARRVFEERFDAHVVYADYADYLAEVALTRRGS